MSIKEIQSAVIQGLLAYRRVTGADDAYLNSQEAALLFGCSYERIREFKAAKLFLPGKLFRKEHLHAWQAATTRFGVSVSKGKVSGDEDGRFSAWLTEYCKEKGLS